MKILVLGGSGFIGSHVCEQLVDAGHDVTVFHPSGTALKNLAAIASRIRIVEGDFNNIRDLEKIVPDAEVVVHLVNATLPGSSLLNPVYDIQMNVVSSVQLFEQCVKAGIEKVVFISSGGTVYGIPNEHPIRESHPLNPISPYGISKLAIEKYLALFHHHYGLDYTILRVSNPFGPRQEPGRGQGVIATWLSKVTRGEPIEIWGDGRVVRDYIYIEDVARAIHQAILNSTTEKIFNVGSGKGHSLLELHALLENQVGEPINIEFREMQKVDVPMSVLDVSLIRSHLSWEPAISIEEGLEMLWRNHQTHI